MTFLGLHGGEGENGKLQASFDLLGIRYTGPDSLGCAVAMDKGLTKQIFMEAGVDTPSGVCLYKEDSDCSLESLGLSFPVVCKAMLRRLQHRSIYCKYRRGIPSGTEKFFPL